MAALDDRLTNLLPRRPRAVVVPAPEGAVDEIYRRMLAVVAGGRVVTADAGFSLLPPSESR